MRRRSLAALLLVLAGPASAKCVGKGASDIADFEALRACHDKERQALIDAVFAKKGMQPTAAQLDALDDRQREEARRFLEGNTLGASDMDLASETPLPPQAPKPKRQAPKAAGDRPEIAGMTDADYELLRGSLGQKSDGGKKGVTPEMADEIRKTLMQKQGGVSPDMERLLKATSRDGAHLSQETMQLLRDAGKQAKGQGLDLGIGADAERQLLEDDLTPAGGQAGRGTN
jgi:hypothetical protein